MNNSAPRLNTSRLIGIAPAPNDVGNYVLILDQANLAQASLECFDK